MNFLIFALLSVALVTVASKNNSTDEWEEFKSVHGKKYSSDEEALRKEIFSKHKALVNLHNQKFANGEVSYSIGINEFSDMTENEKSQRFGARAKTPQATNNRLKRLIGTQAYAFNSTDPVFHMFSADSGFAFPASVDWRKSNWTEAVRNQGSCGSCWAFSSSSMMSFYQFNKTKSNLVFSPQNLVDCAYIWGAGKCNGASPAEALEYMMKQKQTLESNYPYKAVNGTCSVSSTAPLYGITGFVQINNDMNSLKQAVAQLGVVVISIDATYLNYYSSGIWDGTNPTTQAACTTSPNHAVALIGYGTDATTNKPYWLVKNSWGSSWGESGYFRMSMTSSNLCGIYSYNYAMV